MPRSRAALALVILAALAACQSASREARVAPEETGFFIQFLYLCVIT